MPKFSVYFATTVFDDANTGPAIYAQYLWEAFKNDPAFVFHVVTTDTAAAHPRIHPVRRSTRRGPAIYDDVARAALSLAQADERPAVIHGNATYTTSKLVGNASPWIVQVNDYETAEVLMRPFEVIRRLGLRRFAALTWRRHRERRLLRLVDCAICNSEFVRGRVLQAYTGVDPGKLVVINKAVDPGRFERPARLPPDPFGDDLKGVRIMTLGANWRLKGLPDLIEAVAIATETIPDLYLFVGGPSSARDLAAINALADRYGVSGRVRTLGRLTRAQLGACFWHSDIFALASHSEAFGVAAVEAMAAGLPVVCTNVGGLRDVVRDTVDGLLVPPGDPGALAAAICKVAEDKGLRSTFGKNGAARASDFTVERMAGRVRQLYIDLARAKFG